ncbi:MAG: DUF1194 domain-containing protein [Alphaproteobacteria bacterium]|jgi:hypothetical protein|nr:DUF1194 domain-containing protein [Alphaproteobacteria bacterium]
MRRRELLSAAAAGLAIPAKADLAEPVDMLLVLAVDVSRSIDEDEARLQREGYRAGVSDGRVVEAITRGMLGAIAIAYVEWAGSEYQRLVLPWQRIAGQADANRWAETLAEAPRASLSWTSISGGIDFSRWVLTEAPFEATRRVIDISGDGVNNSGRRVERARDEAVADGIIINGLPIINDRPTFGRAPPMPLDQYFQQSVIGGLGSFMVVAEDFDAFGTAVRRKLIREIAGLTVMQA